MIVYKQTKQGHFAYTEMDKRAKRANIIIGIVLITILSILCLIAF